MFAKTTPSGLTSFYALFLDSTEQSAFFEYRPEGLDEGFRTLLLERVNLSDGQLHHIAMTVFGNSFSFFVDGELHSTLSLIAALEDGPGEVFLGRRIQDDSRFAGVWFGLV